MLILISVCPFGISAQDCNELYFSEYLEGSSYNKCIEIYNPSDSSIDLNTKNYKFLFYFNGSTNATTIPLTGIINAYDVFVLCHDSSFQSMLNKSDQTISSAMFNGDDAVALMKDTTMIDLIGEIGVDPGVNWIVGNGATSDYTLVRKYNIKHGDLTWTSGAMQWDVYHKDTDSLLGAHNCICSDSIQTSLRRLEIKSIKVYPNPSADILQIFLPLPEVTATEIRIFDMFGRTIILRSFNLLEGNLFQVSIKHLTSGFYGFILLTNSGSFGGRFIKL